MTKKLNKIFKIITNPMTSIYDAVSQGSDASVENAYRISQKPKLLKK